MARPIIEVSDLSKSYSIGKRESYGSLREEIMQALAATFRKNRGKGGTDTIWALRDVSFEVEEGEVLGIIGRNGAGKSTLLKILSRITEPTEGRVTMRGRVASLLEVGTGFHPELTGRENIFLNGALLGMTSAEIRSKFDEIVAFSEIEKFLDTPVKRYSSGMHVRLAFAVAAHLEPEILIIDEVLAVGDAAFQKKCLGKMNDVAKGGRTVLFVSHNMAAVQRLTARAILLNSGNIVLSAETPRVVAAYLEKSSHSEMQTILRSAQDDFRVESIRFNNEAVESGFNKPLRFDLKLYLECDKYEVHFGFAVVNSIGAKLLTSTCHIDKLSAGESHLSLILKNHHLPPGNYSINFGIDVRQIGILYRENVLGFELSDFNINDSFLTQRRDKIGAYIPCELEVR